MKTGKQEPTFEIIGDYASTIGADVAEMFEQDGGATFYPTQRRELELMLATNADGSPAGVTIGISKPRQNGKSYAARYYAVFKADFEHKKVMYSAHHSTTTNKMFRAICDLFESPERFPDFAADVKSISHVRGYEGIYFKDWVDRDGNIRDGGSIEFATRTNSGSRGGTYSVIIIDEAQEMTTEQQEGLLPVISAATDIRNSTEMPQQVYIGTPPGPACNGTVFAEMHDKAHSENPGSGWWMEWAIESKDIEKDVPDAETALRMAYDTNPAMGYRIAEKTVLNEYEHMNLDGFCRERLGWWSPTTTKQVSYAIKADAWNACASDALKPEGKTAFGIKLSVDGSMVCLCGAVQPADGPARISLIDLRPTGYGLSWLADWLNLRYEKACCVVIDGKNGVDVLIDKISPVWKMKGSVIRPRVTDVIGAVSMLTDAVNERTLTWFSGQELLKESAITSTKRPISGGWGFGGDNSLPIEACALALYGVKTSKRDPSKRMRIG